MGYHVRGQPEHPGGGGGVDVRAGGERLEQARVAAEVGEDAQFDLAVIGNHEGVAGGRHERPTDGAPFLGAHRDVLHVRLLG